VENFFPRRLSVLVARWWMATSFWVINVSRQATDLNKKQTNRGEWMMGKFVNANALRLLSFALLLGAPALAQTTPAESTPAAPAAGPQTPAAQAPAAAPSAGDQELADEEATVRKPKPKEYKNWNYNVGAGASLESGNSKTFVRQGGYQGTAGVTRNANKYLGLRADFIAADLPLRQSALNLAQAGSATSYLLGGTLGPIINIPVSKLYGGYLAFGGGYYHRSGSLHDDTAIPGSSCNKFFEWWGSCSSFSIPLSGSFVNTSQNEFGYNFGAGITRKMPSGVEVYAEFRLLHGSANNTTTDVRPITVGVRW
jgi:hypothetical protein